MAATTAAAPVPDLEHHRRRPDEQQNEANRDESDRSETEESSTNRQPRALVVPSSSLSSASVAVFSPEMLHQYYSRLFPFDLLHAWLSYGGNSALFSRREFSMTLEPAPGEEIYLRYQSFAGAQELRDAVLKRRPVKIDLGAVFSHPPKDHKSVSVRSGGFAPLQRELVFDIDLTDYDDVRNCGCSGASICSACWAFVAMAVQVLDEGLKEDFGFGHVAWFYSGRRGVHAWVCDPAARELTDAGRTAVANYFEVRLGHDKNKDVHLDGPLHPMLERAFRVLEPLFVQKILVGHKLLDNPEKWNAFLDHEVPEAASDVRDALRKEWNSHKPSVATPQQKWNLLVAHWTAFLKAHRKPSSGGKSAKKLSHKDWARLEVWPAQVVFRHSYPRLDVNVSKMRNHLLKSPWCVHPKTGRVCVPFLARDAQSFDPFAVPTLPQLLQELDAAASANNSDVDNGASSTAKLDWQKTSLKPYYEAFQTSFLEPLLQSVHKQERDVAERQAALVGDF